MVLLPPKYYLTKECVMANLVTKILAIDDESSIIASIHGILGDEDYHIVSANNGKTGLKALTAEQPDLVIVDYMMPELNGIEFIKAAKSIYPNTPIIVMTAHGDKQLSLSFLKEGAFRYVEKPFDVEEFRLTVADAAKHHALLRENAKLQDILKINDDFPEIVGDSPAMKMVFETISKVADTDITVLILGESGTGKELIAKAIHEKSALRDGPFIRFNCAALPETLIESELFGHEKGSFTGAEQTKLGRFELAQNGTIFLDEVGELSQSMQVKLLRILQEREFERVGGTTTIQVNVRVVAATNRNIQAMVASGDFREDLYYRLSVFPLELPPLRERRGDALALAKYFLQRYSKRYHKQFAGFSETAMSFISDYQWKGNVRELENVISRAVILCSDPVITDRHLSIERTSSSNFIQEAIHNKWTESDLVKYYANEVFRFCDENKKETAEFLDINFRTLVNRLNG
jgi:DNA-binding NtrC family response regulator